MLINLVNLSELNKIVLGNRRAWVYSQFPRIPTGYVERPNFPLSALKWQGKNGNILLIIMDVELAYGQAELCFFDFIGKITSDDVKRFCDYFGNSFAISQIRTTVPINDDYIDVLLSAGFNHVAFMQDHICISLNTYINAVILNYKLM